MNEHRLAGYQNSHALIIGINSYPNHPLNYAVNDACALKEILENKCGFNANNIKLLLDENATKLAIHKAFMSFAMEATGPDDRLLLYFAGHGTSVPGSRGMVGYIVPHDGDPCDLSSLIKYSELISETDLIIAKHLLFVFDACFSGIAITRKPKSASLRYYRDMMTRSSLQVICAGKHDEVVSDGGGPLPDHSIFTGYFLKSLLESDSRGYISANDVMADVFHNVANDQNSYQSPHYGNVRGDGDFFFITPELKETPEGETMSDILIPYTGEDDIVILSPLDTAKMYLANNDHRIKLFDLIVDETRSLISKLSVDGFSSKGTYSDNEFFDRVNRYNEIMKIPCALQMLLAFWGNDIHEETITLLPLKLAEIIGLESGNRGWLDLRWYPIFKLLYCTGLGAIAGKKYKNLLTVLNAEITDPTQRYGNTIFIYQLYKNIESYKAMFSKFPERSRQFVPFSEYLHTELQPLADDILFTGASYERLFNKLESLLFLEHFCHDGSWGPPGRFSWMLGRGFGNDPLNDLIEEANKKGPEWDVLKAGFFKGSAENMEKTFKAGKSFNEKLRWG